ncbi:MAG: ABC transporter ATP-binding protein [Pirellulales bacterium]|nr:ABC transporter ATP-binding protein [Pirellulales bacterium]
MKAWFKKRGPAPGQESVSARDNADERDDGSRFLDHTAASVPADLAVAPLAEFTAVSKWYGPVIAVNHVSLQLGQGITGLVGPNGAGKSTLIRLLTGQVRPSIGQVRVRGRHAWSAAAKSHLGYCPDVDAFYEEMSGRAFVRTLARLHGLDRHRAIERTEAVLDEVGMSDRADRPLASYSKGMRQRVKLAQALIHGPELIVLDEPLNGVDPVGRVELAALFHRLAARGKAVLISSHVLEEMDHLADRVLFLCQGRLLASGSPAEVREMLDDHPLKVRVWSSRPRELAGRLLAAESVRAAEMEGSGTLLFNVDHPQEFFKLLADVVVDEGLDVEEFQVIDASTQAVFNYLMKRGRHV